MADAAPPELGELLRNVFYKHYAPLALQNQGIRQQYLAGLLKPHHKLKDRSRNCNFVSRQ
jgi:hypothetical protein